ncbi:MAG: YdcF family protein [Candidatus Doudnabacteria bacterium]|nr:YdcF family protein [Candidatus Doudnabacteria bacterium]
MRRRVFKAVKIGAFVFVGAFLLDACLVFGFALTSPHVKKADAIVILGAAINTPALYNRTLEALRLYEEGFAPVVVLSGGRISDKDISEATYMLRVMDKNSKNPINVILEEHSGSTYENLKNTREKLPKASSIIVVSDSYHLARGFFMAKSQGFKNVYWSSPKTSSYYKPGELVFHYFREMAAMVSYLPKFLFG